MTPLKSGQSTARDWQQINKLSADHSHAAQSAAVSRTRIEGVIAPADISSGFHPFKLYQLPRYWRLPEDVKTETDWRTFRVRAGMVLGAYASGTDQQDDLPDDEILDPTITCDIIAPDDNDQFWFWLELGTDGSGNPTATVRYAPDAADITDPTELQSTTKSTDYDDGVNPAWTSTNPWTTAPIPDATHIPIGWIDANTNASTFTPIVRQLLRADIVTKGGGGGGGASGPYRIKDVWADYLECVEIKWTWDAEAEPPDWVGTEGETRIYIAKENLHRENESMKVLGYDYDLTYLDGPEETWDGVTSSEFNKTRHVVLHDNTSYTEDQRIIPPWSYNEEIMAIEANTGVYRGDGESGEPVDEKGTPVTLLIVGRSCQWAGPIQTA